MIHGTDVDIDVADRNQVLEGLPSVAACMVKNNKNIKHNSGVYFQNIPFDPVTGMATIDYKEAEDMGYFKIDILNNSVYENVRDEEHLIALMGKEPSWGLLEYRQIVEQLFHINKYATLVGKLKPTTVEELAMVLALIRPAKAYLQDKSWAVIKDRIWQVESDEYTFKKSHAIAYAMVIVVQMNLLAEQASADV